MDENNIFMKLKQDEDKNISIQWFEGDGITPDPFLEPVRAELEIKANVMATDYLLRLDSDDGDITITASTGKIVLHFTKDNTVDLDFDSAVVDIVITEATGDTGVTSTTRDLRGTVYLIRKVTTREAT
jgi:hypothetical protein